MLSLRQSVVGAGLSVAAVLSLGVGIASASRQPAINSNCTNATQCVSAKQAGTGNGVLTGATSGVGVKSTATSGTAVLGTATTGIGVSGTSGGVGVNGASSGSAAGVSGTSATGNGVSGSSSGAGNGVNGTSATGAGIWGTSTSGAGVYGLSPGNFGVQGILQNPGTYFLSGVYGEVDGNPVGSAGVYGIDTSGVAQNGAYQNAGVQGVSANNIGVFGSTVPNVVLQQGSSTGLPYVAGVAAFAGAISGGNSSNPGIGVVSFNGTTSDANGNSFAAIEMENIGGGNDMLAFNAAGAPVMSLDNNGNLILSGSIYANGITDCSGGDPSCPTGPNGEAKVGQNHSYTSRQDVPTMETVGEGQLTNGSARVPLGAYASKIDTSKNYLVFITPQGQTQGTLYVAGKSPSGFAVREGQGGHSTVAFDYRVVGVPAHFGENHAVPHGHPNGIRLIRPHAVSYRVRSYGHIAKKH